MISLIALLVTGACAICCAACAVDARRHRLRAESAWKRVEQLRAGPVELRRTEARLHGSRPVTPNPLYLKEGKR